MKLSTFLSQLAARVLFREPRSDVCAELHRVISRYLGRVTGELFSKSQPQSLSATVTRALPINCALKLRLPGNNFLRMWDNVEMNLLLFFASLKPKGLGLREARKRDEFYAWCFKRADSLTRTRPWRTLVVENTQLTEKNFFSTKLGRSVGPDDVLIVDSNLGEENKGLGELNMLAAALSSTDISQYESIAYFTGRRLITNPYVFDVVERNPGMLVVGNPDFLYLNGSLVESEKLNMLGDMFFAMPPNSMAAYSKFAEDLIQSGLPNGWGSEQILYSFVRNSGLDSVWLESYGFLRFDKVKFGKRNWHVC